MPQTRVGIGEFAIADRVIVMAVEGGDVPRAPEEHCFRPERELIGAERAAGVDDVSLACSGGDGDAVGSEPVSESSVVNWAGDPEIR